MVKSRRPIYLLKRVQNQQVLRCVFCIVSYYVLICSRFFQTLGFSSAQNSNIGIILTGRCLVVPSWVDLASVTKALPAASISNKGDSRRMQPVRRNSIISTIMYDTIYLPQIFLMYV
jgi:hypothetical protein